MKRTILCIIFALISTLISLDVFATGNDDSLKISADITDTVTNSSNDTVIRLYNSRYMRRFAEHQAILEQIESANEVYMVIEPSGKISYQKRWQDGFSDITASPYPDWSDFYIYATSPELVFDSTVEIANVYCLDGTPSREHVYIYYATDSGDYILFKENLYDEKMYLFPLNDFYDFAEAVWNEQKKFIDSDGGSGKAIYELYDLQPYEFTPKDNSHTFIWIVAITTIILLGGLVAFVMTRKRKNQA